MNIFIAMIDNANEGVFSTEAEAQDFLDTHAANFGAPECAEIQNWIIGGGMVESIQFSS